MAQAAPRHDGNRRRRWLLLPLVVLLLAAVAWGSAWWFSPSGKAFQYRRADLVSLRRTTENNPNDFAAWKEMGLRLAGRGNGPLAESYLRQAFKLNPGDADSATALGEILHARGADAEAFQILKTATERNPRFAEAHLALGRLYKRKASYHHAAAEFEAAAAADPTLSEAWYEQSTCYLNMQESDKAHNAIDQALRLEPNEPQYLALKGSVDVAIGKVDVGIAESERAAKLAPRNIRIVSNLINMLLANHRGDADLAEAERLIGQLEAVAPSQPLLAYQRGELERLRGHYPASAAYLEKAAISAPGQDEIFFSLSQTYRRMGRSADADRALAVYRRRQALRQQIDRVRIELGGRPNDTAVMVRLADLQVAARDISGAIDTLQAARRIDPKSQPVLTRLRKLQPQDAAAGAQP